MGNDDWIEWTGGDCPVYNHERVELSLASGEMKFSVANAVNWESSEIVAYRLPDVQPTAKQPRAKQPTTRPITKTEVETMHEKYPAYFKDVSKLDSIDVYRVHRLFGVTDPVIHHASKKLLMAGGRTGEKFEIDDVREARDSLTRWLAMEEEDKQ